MIEHEQPVAAALPIPPYDVVVLGAGRVGRSIARALRNAGHTVIAELRRDDDPLVIAQASLVVIAVPDDALREAAGLVARLGRRGVVVMHTCGIAGIEPLTDCGPLIAAVHPAVPVASPEQDLAGVPFGITAADPLRAWCETFVRELGGVPVHIDAADRARYHAALCMASNYVVALAADAAGLVDGHELLAPLMRATVENIASLGPADALTGPIVRGDVGTVRAHLRALPPELRASYVENGRRALTLATSSGRLDDGRAQAIRAVLDEGTGR